MIQSRFQITKKLCACVVFFASVVLTVSAGTGIAAASPAVTPNYPAHFPAHLTSEAPMPPVQNAPISAWKAWSEHQNAWIRSIPYAQAFANEGFTLLHLGFGPTHWEPGLGLPPGITETAVWWVVRPITPTAPTQTK